MNASGRTAIARKKLSAPMQYLHEQGKLTGRCLDYGCGRGFDADTLGMDGYDPNHRPSLLPFLKAASGYYQTVTCNYVLNVIEDETERTKALDIIRGLLADDGVAYVTVRADVKELKGRTSTGTWQGDIRLPLPVEHETKGYRMYRLTK